jgi:hypothetical protein
MVIPRIRVITADRKIRETARLVESMLATARDDAVVQGFAGLEFVRNPNYTNGVTTLYRLKMPPPYTGDFVGDGAYVSDTASLPSDNPKIYPVQLPATASYTPGADDYIQFNWRGHLYRMTSATTFEVWDYQVPPPLNPPPPSLSAPAPFKIYRQPTRVLTSELRLPGGQFVDLEYSGDQDTSGGAATLNGRLNPTPLPSPNNTSFIVLFDKHGAIERYYPQGFGAGGSLLPGGPLFLAVVSDEAAKGIGSLDNLSNLWVSVNHTNGAVQVSEMGSNNPTSPPATRLSDARALALKRRTAQQ